MPVDLETLVGMFSLLVFLLSILVIVLLLLLIMQSRKVTHMQYMHVFASCNFEGNTVRLEILAPH